MSFRRLLPLLLVLCTACSDPEKPADETPSADAPAAGRNVVIYLIDTLRADHVGTYGYERATTPNLDRFANESLVFENAHSHSPFTATSHATLFTSLYQDTHGVWNKLVDEAGQIHFPDFDESNFTLAEAFTKAGYRTAAFADGGMLSRRRKFHQGFETFSSVFEGVDKKVERAIDWLESRPDDRPFFLFVHTYQTHIPLLPEPAQVDAFMPAYDGPLKQALVDGMAAHRATVAETGKPASMSGSVKDFHQQLIKPHLLDDAPMVSANRQYFEAMYDATIVQADAGFERLRARLEALDLLDDTVLMVTSDHGDEFWEYNRNGHVKVYEELTHVPLIVRLPGGAHAARRTEPVGLVDVMPTLLTATGIKVPARVDGRAFELFGAGADWSDRATFAAANQPEAMMSYRRGDLKAIFRTDPAGPPELFDLGGDPQHAAFMREALDTLDQWRRDWLEKGVRLGLRKRDLLEGLDGEIDEEWRTELDELGYMGS